MFGWCTFMKLTLMKKGCPASWRVVEEFDRGLLDIAVEERDADDAFLAVDRGVSTYWPLILKSSVAGLAGLAGQRAFRHLLEHRAEFRGPCRGTRSDRRRCRR